METVGALKATCQVPDDHVLFRRIVQVVWNAIVCVPELGTSGGAGIAGVKASLGSKLNTVRFEYQVIEVPGRFNTQCLGAAFTPKGR